MPRNPSHELADAARRIADTYIGRSEQAWRVPANQAPAQDERIPRPPPITPIEYIGLQRAFDFFNVMLFEESLPDVMMTLQTHNSGGYFWPDRFIERTSAQTKQHELALNPDAFTSSTSEFIASVLVHEMVHLWQHTHGNRLRPGYHDRQWGAKMKELGLYPSSTRAPSAARKPATPCSTTSSPAARSSKRSKHSRRPGGSQTFSLRPDPASKGRRRAPASTRVPARNADKTAGARATSK